MPNRTGQGSSKRTKKHPKNKNFGGKNRSSQKRPKTIESPKYPKTNPLQIIGRPLTKSVIFLLKFISFYSQSLLVTNPNSFASHRYNKLKKQFSRKKNLKKATKRLPKDQQLSTFFIVFFRIIYTSSKNLLTNLKKSFSKKHQITSNLSKHSQSFQNFLSERSRNRREKQTTKAIANTISKLKKDYSKTIHQTASKFRPKSTIAKITDSTLHLFALPILVLQKIYNLTSKAASSFFNLSIFNKTTRILNKTRSFKFTWFFGLSFISLIIGISLGLYIYVIRDLPDASVLATTQPILTTKIYDRNGNLLYKIYKNENRTLVNLKEIPLNLQHATLAIEDQDFYKHPGISIRGIARALKVNATSNSSPQGGSTITQQLIKNTLLTPEKTLQRKIKEALLSVITEFYFTKDEILTMYFNQVPYGGAAYGVQEASRMYFGKDVSQLSLAESAYLAGLPAAPTHYSPYGTNPQLAKNRQLQTIARMIEEGYITREEAAKAVDEQLQVKPPTTNILAPHFVMYIKDQLAQKYGHRLVEQGGLEVTTSLDLQLQEFAQQTVSQEVESLRNLNVTNGSALITNPQTGEILAMVGSIDYFNTESDGQVNITIRPRQPGSSIKPLNYAMALENGFTPSTIIPDTPICYNIEGQPPYCPKNYDSRYHGRVTLRKALANSYNIPAVKTLFQFGVDKFIDKATLMGISTWTDRNRFGLSLTLGGGEVTMIDMATAYGVFANQGMRVDLNPILEVKTADGKILEQSCAKTSKPCPSQKALDPRVAYQITDILSDNQARSEAFGTNSVLNIPNHQVSVKTGTTNDLRDNWTIGYTSDRLIATWVGNNDNHSMSYIASGITGASPIWNKLTVALLDPDTHHHFEPPTNLVKVQVCTITGSLACNGCPSKEEYFLPGTEPKNHCTSDQIARILNPPPPENKDD